MEQPNFSLTLRGPASQEEVVEIYAAGLLRAKGTALEGRGDGWEIAAIRLLRPDGTTTIVPVSPPS